MARLGRSSAWLRWLLVWLGLLGGVRLAFAVLLPPIYPSYFLWFGAFVLSCALTLLILPSPVDNQ